MAKRYSLLALLAGTLAIAAAYASAFLPGPPPAWAAWAMAMGTAVVMVASTALGAARNGKIGRLKIPFALVFLVLAGGFALALGLPAETADAPLFLGLPIRAAVVLIGIGLVPLLVLPVAYALTFEEMTLSEEDLARIREAAKALQAASAPRADVRPSKPVPAEVEV